MAKKRRNYPGDLRTPGTKDYGVILSNLIKYKNELVLEQEEYKTIALFLKIAEKLQELGFKKDSNKVKRRAESSEKLDKKRTEIMKIASEKWKEGKQKHDAVKAEEKQKAKEARLKLAKERRLSRAKKKEE